MSRHEKLLARVLAGGADANIGFDELCGLLRALGFAERTSGSHHVFTRADVEELINLQAPGRQAKAYQVRQIPAVLVSYGIAARPMHEEE